MRSTLSLYLQWTRRYFALGRRREVSTLRGLWSLGVLCSLLAGPGAGQGTAAQPPILLPQASGAAAAPGTAATPPSAGATPGPSASQPAPPANCLESGDGYLRARLGDAIETKINWPNSGTRCQGEPKDNPAGVRLSFQRAAGRSPDLLFVFGITGVREGKPARAVGVNLTVIVQGTSRIYGTLGDSRCTVDALTQRPLRTKGAYRVEARGFCTQPAHAVRGNGALLVSTFEFAGVVNFNAPETQAPAQSVSTVR